MIKKIIIILIILNVIFYTGYYFGLQDGYQKADDEFRNGMIFGYGDGDKLNPLVLDRDYNHNVSEGGYLVGYMYGYPYKGNFSNGIHKHEMFIKIGG